MVITGQPHAPLPARQMSPTAAAATEERIELQEEEEMVPEPDLPVVVAPRPQPGVLPCTCV